MRFKSQLHQHGVDDGGEVGTDVHRLGSIVNFNIYRILSVPFFLFIAVPIALALDMYVGIGGQSQFEDCFSFIDGHGVRFRKINLAG